MSANKGDSYKFLVFLIAGFFILTSCLQAKKRIGISIKGGFYSPLSSTLNNKYIPQINQAFVSMATGLGSFGLSTELAVIEKIGGSTTYGGEIELFFMPHFSLALSGEYWEKKALSASVDATGNIEGSSFNTNMKYVMDVSLIPIVGTIRYNLPYKRLVGYLGFGVGYYIGKINYSWEYKIKKDEFTYYNEYWEYESLGISIIPNVNLGLEFKITNNIFIAADLKSPLGSIKSFEIKKSTLDSTEIGEELGYVDIDGNEKPMKWELTGFHIGISSKIKF